jgi:hypothetical protein
MLAFIHKDIEGIRRLHSRVDELETKLDRDKDAAPFRIDEHRAQDVFNSLIGGWKGALDRDGGGLSRSWVAH